MLPVENAILVTQMTCRLKSRKGIEDRIQQQITASNPTEDDAPASIDRGGGDQSEATHFYLKGGRVGRRHCRSVLVPLFSLVDDNGSSSLCNEINARLRAVVSGFHTPIPAPESCTLLTLRDKINGLDRSDVNRPPVFSGAVCRDYFNAFEWAFVPVTIGRDRKSGCATAVITVQPQILLPVSGGSRTGYGFGNSTFFLFQSNFPSHRETVNVFFFARFCLIT